MSIVEIDGLSAADLQTLPQLPTLKSILGIVKLVAGNFPSGFQAEAITVDQLIEVFKSVIQTPVNNLADVAYPTLAEALTHIADLPSGKLVLITNDGANNGLYLSDGTTLNKTDYDAIVLPSVFRDIKTIMDVVKLNETTNVTSQYGDVFYTLKKALYQVIQTGGFEPFLTQAQLLASVPTVPKKAAKAMDTKKIWYWDGMWHDTGLSELDQAKDYVDSKIYSNDLDSITLTDQSGFVLFSISNDYFKTNEIETSIVKIDGEILKYLNGNGLSFIDKNGFYFNLTEILNLIKSQVKDTYINTEKVVIDNETITSINDDGLILIDKSGFKLNVLNYSQSSSVQPEISEKMIISKLESEVASRMQMYKKPFNHNVARIRKALNIIIVYGQSFAVADKGSTWVTRTASTRGNLMLGLSPRGAHSAKTNGVTYANFDAIGGNTYHLLKECGQYGNNGTIWNAVGDGGRDTPAWGETICSGLLETMKELHNLDVGYQDDETIFAISTIGANGATIAELAKNNSETMFYNRYLTCLDGHLEAASAAGYTDIQVLGIVYLQGESNTNTSTYLTELRDMKNNMVADAVAKTGQSKNPAFFVHQIGGNHPSTNASKLTTSMKELEICEIDKGVFQIGIHAGYPNPQGHLWANSYRWFGCKIGNIMYRVLSGKYQTIFKALRATHYNDTVYVSFQTPFPPLKFKEIFNTKSVYEYVKNYGFDVYVNNISRELKSVNIVGDNTVALVLKDKPSASDVIEAYIGGNNTDNNHNIFDSNYEISVFDWKYYGDLGQQSGENIPILNNKPLGLSEQTAIQYIVSGAY